MLNQQNCHLKSFLNFTRPSILRPGRHSQPAPWHQALRPRWHNYETQHADQQSRTRPCKPTLTNLCLNSPYTRPQILTALRRSRKGAAPGPSGLTADTLRLVLDDETTTALFVEVCQHLAQARVPLNIAQAIGLGRMVALTKPNGGIRGLVIGDVLRRVIARCIAQVFATQFHAACAPHQFALSTRGGRTCTDGDNTKQQQQHNPIH